MKAERRARPERPNEPLNPPAKKDEVDDDEEKPRPREPLSAPSRQMMRMSSSARFARDTSAGAEWE